MYLNICSVVNYRRLSDVHETFQAETETLGILFEARPRRDVLDLRRDQDVAAAETLTETYGI